MGYYVKSNQGMLVAATISGMTFFTPHKNAAQIFRSAKLANQKAQELKGKVILCQE